MPGIGNLYKCTVGSQGSRVPARIRSGYLCPFGICVFVSGLDVGFGMHACVCAGDGICVCVYFTNSILVMGKEGGESMPYSP